MYMLPYPFAHSSSYAFTGGRARRAGGREGERVTDNKFSHVTLHVMLGRVWRCRRCGSLVCTLRDERDDGLMVEVHEL